MIRVSRNILTQLTSVLNDMSGEEFKTPLEIFSGASVSQHVRHILEFYICLIDCQGTLVNYDKRKRDLRLEQDFSFTLSMIDQIHIDLEKLDENKVVKLEANLGEIDYTVDSSMKREILYAVEHAVHHMAILKMGIMINFPQIKLPENFGVADSTIQYRNQCAQ